jgi:hypothetical protein
MFGRTSTIKEKKSEEFFAEKTKYTTSQFADLASIDDVYLLTIQRDEPGNQSALATICVYDGASRRAEDSDMRLHFTHAAWTGGGYVRSDITYEIPYPHTLQGRRIATVGRTPPSRGGAD